MTTINDVLLNMEPCEEGAEWLVTQPNLATAWENCKRSDWMLWLSEQLDILTDQQDLAIQLVVLDTPLADGSKVVDLITDARSLTFIELKRQRLAGVEIDQFAWSAAWDAAWDAARTAAWDAARTAACDAAWSASEVAAWDAAGAAAGAAARAAARAAAPAAWDAAWDAAGSWQADRIREIVGNPFIKEAS